MHSDSLLSAFVLFYDLNELADNLVVRAGAVGKFEFENSYAGFFEGPCLVKWFIQANHSFDAKLFK